MAKSKINRREFIGRSAALGAVALIGGKAWGRPAAEPIGLAVVSGSDPDAMAVKAVEILGGMKAFVPKGAKVALLPNVQSKHPGTFTKPGILRAVIRMCKEAGAAQIDCLSLLTQAHWDGAGLTQVVQEEGIGLKLIPRDEAGFKAVPIPGGQALTEARIAKELDAYDLYINLPITKDHAGNKFTGTLKNHMGLNGNNRVFHKTNWKTDPADIDFLETCIVDLNTVLKPHLNIVDAVEIITSNGPMGPGDLAKPGQVIAGVDRVAVDAYCAKAVLGLVPADIACIRKAHERGLGQIDLAKVRIVKASI